MLTTARTYALSATTLQVARRSMVPMHGMTFRASHRTLSNIVTSPFSDVEQPSGNFVNVVFENAHRWGTKVAVESLETGRNYTYNHLQEAIWKWAGFLSAMGLAKGDTIAIYMPNNVEYPVIMFGAISIGVIVTTLNCHYTADEVVRQLESSKAQLVVSVPELEETILRSLLMIKETMQVVMTGPSKVQRALNLQDILKDPTIPYAHPVQIAGEEIALMPYSSGTTGRPKGVALSHNALSINLRMICHPQVLASKSATEDYQTSFLCLLPFYHLYGISAIKNVGLNIGAKLLPLTRFEPNSFVNAIRKTKAEILYTVPPLVKFLIHSPLVSSDDLSSVKHVVVSASPMAPVTAQALQKKLSPDTTLQEMYGMSEAVLTSASPVCSYKLGTVGQLLPNVAGKIINNETGEDLSPTDTGEICIKTPSRMNGYINNKEATATAIDAGGWIHTGDVGSFDSEGYLMIVDRTKDLIKVKGFQVSPSELEDVIISHPQVLDVCVVGVPHERFGEVPKAYVITKEEIEAEDIYKFLEDKVAPYKKLVGGVTFVNDLPRTATGKMLRKDLKAKIIKEDN